MIPKHDRRFAAHVDVPQIPSEMMLTEVMPLEGLLQTSRARVKQVRVLHVIIPKRYFAFASELRASWGEKTKTHVIINFSSFQIS